MTDYTTAGEETSATNASIDLPERDARALREPLCVVENDPATTDGEVAVYSGARRYVVDVATSTCSCPDDEYNLAAGELCKHARRVAYRRGDRAVPARIRLDDVDDLLRGHLVFEARECPHGRTHCAEAPDAREDAFRCADCDAEAFASIDTDAEAGSGTRVATDGGDIIIAGDDGVILDEDSSDDIDQGDEHDRARTDGGGVVVAGDDAVILDADSVGNTDDRPAACECHSGWSERQLPCFECWRAGFETVRPDVEADPDE